MSEERQEKLKEIFDTVLSMPYSERGAYLSEICDGDQEMRREIESLLISDKNGKVDFEQPVFNIFEKIVKQMMRHAEETDRADEEEERNLEGTKITDALGTELYLLDKLVRFGKMAILFTGKNLKTSKKVIIKIPRKTYATDPNIRNNYRNELNALKSITDDRIVEIYEDGEMSDGRPYLVLKFIEGENLGEFISRFKEEKIQTKLADIEAIVRQIGFGLQSAHDAGIIHRDIKPENIMIRGEEGDRRITIIDFNISEADERAKRGEHFTPLSTAIAQLTGTPGYYAPEQAIRKEATKATDVFSLAITAYELLTFELPFGEDENYDLTKILNSEFALPSQKRKDIPAEADELFKRALAFNPEVRPQSSKEFASALAEALQNSKGFDPLKNTEKPETRKQKYFVAASALSLLVFIVIASGVWYLFSPQDEVTNKNTNTNTTPEITTPLPKTDAKTITDERSFIYSLELRRMSNGKPVDNSARQATGREMFITGDEFRVKIKSPQDGYLYILNEGSEKKGSSEGKITFIVQEVFEIKKNKEIETAWLAFFGSPGTEKFWFVFAKNPVKELEQFKTSGTQIPIGRNSYIREFLNKHRLPDSSGEEDKENLLVSVKGSKEIIAYQASFAHR